MSLLKTLVQLFVPNVSLSKATFFFKYMIYSLLLIVQCIKTSSSLFLLKFIGFVCDQCGRPHG